MLKTLLAFFFFTMMTAASAQLSISIEPNPIHGSGDASSQEIKAIAMVTNTSDVEVALHWIREVVEAPEEWLSWVCDTRACYDPSFGASPSVNPNILAPGEVMEFQAYVRPNKIDGVAQINFDIYDASDPEVILGTVQTTFETTVTSTVDTDISELRIYPNPATTYFRIFRGENVSTIALYDVVGSPVNEFAMVEDGRYDVSGLPDGMYFARLLGRNGEVIKTVRLSKR